MPCRGLHGFTCFKIMPWNLIAANFLSHILESIANLVNELHSLPLKYAGAHIQLLTSGYSVYPTTSQLVICITCVHLWDSAGLHFFTYSVLRHMFSYPRASPRSLAKMLPGLLWMSWEAAAKRHIGKELGCGSMLKSLGENGVHPQKLCFSLLF